MLSTVSPVMVGAEAASPQPTTPLSASTRTSMLSACRISTPAMNTGFFIGKADGDRLHALDLHGAISFTSPQAVCSSNLDQRAEKIAGMDERDALAGDVVLRLAAAQHAHAILRQACRPCRRRHRRRGRSDECRRSDCVRGIWRPGNPAATARSARSWRRRARHRRAARLARRFPCAGRRARPYFSRSCRAAAAMSGTTMETWFKPVIMTLPSRPVARAR